jgi:GxxExxY protein
LRAIGLGGHYLVMNELEVYEPLTEKVLGCAFEVINTLGCGFLEKVYERALVVELRLRGLKASGQALVPVSYKGRPVGDYFADLLVEDQLIVELKCVERLGDEQLAQCINYLRASGRTVCLLLNFQRPRLEWRRVLLDATDGSR